MQTLTGIGFVIIGAILTIVASVEPRRTHLSVYELERRKKNGNTPAADELRRRVLIDDILSLRHILEVLLLVVLTVIAVTAFGALLGIIASVLAAVYYGRIAQIDTIRSLAQRIYDPYEESILRFIEKNPAVCRMLRSIPPSDREDTKLHSREELEHLVKHSHGILREEEKKLIINGLHFESKTVAEIMMPRGAIESIDKTAVLGPVVLNDLHKTGHTRFPIIDKDIDHIVGILQIRGLLRLDDKDTHTAGELMDKNVYYINEDQELHHALAAFLRTHHHLFIVVNEYGETSGVVSIEDVMEALLGKRILDEYDSHDDLKTVAKRNAKAKKANS